MNPIISMAYMFSQSTFALNYGEIHIEDFKKS